MLLFINFDEEVGRVKTKLFPGGKKTKLSTYLFIYLLTLPYNNNQNLKKLKKKKEKKMKKKKKQKMARTPQHSCQLQQAQNIKENKTRERKKAINLYATSNLTLPN